MISRRRQTISSRTQRHQGDTSTAKSCRSRGAAFGSFGAPQRVTAQHAPPVVVERCMACRVETLGRAHQRVGTSSSHQWGPLALTVRRKHSFQGGPTNELDCDSGSFARRAFRISAPCAFGHEVQFARGCSTFHSFTRVLLDRPQSG